MAERGKIYSATGIKIKRGEPIGVHFFSTGARKRREAERGIPWRASKRER